MGLAAPGDQAMAKQSRRRKFLVDNAVQGALAARVGWYWLFFAASVAMLLIVWTAFVDRPQRSGDLFATAWTRVGPALLASILLLPLVMIDVLRLSNRFAGPMYRVRNGLRQLARGETVAPIVLRKKDYWTDVARDFNLVAERMERRGGTAAAKQRGADGAGETASEELAEAAASR